MNFCTTLSYKIFLIFISVLPNVLNAGSIDYQYPRVTDLENYEQYKRRPFDHYEQKKVTLSQFMSMFYNPIYQVLPHPESVINYETYRMDLREKINQFSSERIQTQLNEKNNLRTGLAERLEAAKKYIGMWTRLPREDYEHIVELYLLFPKSYEDHNSFLKTRIKLAQFIKKNSTKYPIGKDGNASKNNNDKSGLLTGYGRTPSSNFDLLTSRYQLKRENFKSYVIRARYLDIVPSDEELFSKNNFVSSSDKEVVPYLRTKYELPVMNLCERVEMSRNGVVKLVYHTYKNFDTKSTLYPGTLLEIKCLSNENNHHGTKLLRCSYDGNWGESNPKMNCGVNDVTLYTYEHLNN